MRDRLGTRHWRGARHDRRALAGAAVGVLVLHILFVLLVWQQMRTPSAPQFVQVELGPPLRLDLGMPRKRPTAPSPPVPPVPMPMRAPPSTPHPPNLPHSPHPPAKDARVASVPSPAASVGSPPVAAAPRLFNRNGAVILPATTSAPTPEPGYVQRMPQGDTQIMRDQQLLPPRPTVFSQAWGKGGGPVTRALDKVVQKTTVTHTFHPLPGVRIHCALSLAMLAGGCGGTPPPPPSVKDGDERLNMAPPPLAPSPHPLVPPSVASCIAVYSDGKPLPQGCPTDTPARAFRQLLDDCVSRYRSGKRLPTDCPADIPARAAKAAGTPPP